MTLRTLIGASLAVLCVTADARTQIVDLPWPKHLSASDRRDLLALARKMGMPPPMKIVKGGVESTQTVNEHEFRWSFAMMVRDDDHMSLDRARRMSAFSSMIRS
jgi:hypothetical protein